MLKRIITDKMLIDNPNEKWNQFVDLLAMEDYNNLSEIQKIPKLCFWYDSEVQNGDHLQYFLNQGVSLLNETYDALKKLGACSQSKILSKAIHILHKRGLADIETVEEFVEEAFIMKFDDLDSKYYDCEPTIDELLAKYLLEHEQEFIIKVPSE